MKFPMVLTATALALGTAAYAAPALRLPVGFQQNANEAGLDATETSQGYVKQGDVNAGWLHLISGDRDDDEDDCEGDDRDDDDCDDEDGDNHNGNASGPQTPSTPPQNGLFNAGKAPVIKSN